MTPAEAFQAGVEVGEKAAELRRELAQARYRREQLDYGPLMVRMNDDVADNNRDRWATPEEVASWKAEADATVKELEAQLATLLAPPATLQA